MALSISKSDERCPENEQGVTDGRNRSPANAAGKETCFWFESAVFFSMLCASAESGAAPDVIKRPVRHARHVQFKKVLISIISSVEFDKSLFFTPPYLIIMPPLASMVAPVM